MKKLLSIVSVALLLSSITAQNATTSTIYFNPTKGLDAEHQQKLADVYCNMSDLKYHCFNLVSQQEMGAYPSAKLLKITKARANKVMEYYRDKQQIENKTNFFKLSPKCEQNGDFLLESRR